MAESDPGRILTSIFAGVVALATAAGLVMPMAVLNMGESGQRAHALAGNLLALAVLATLGATVVMAANAFLQRARAGHLLIGTGILVAGWFPLANAYTETGDRFAQAAGVLTIVGASWLVLAVALGRRAPRAR